MAIGLEEKRLKEPVTQNRKDRNRSFYFLLLSAIAIFSTYENLIEKKLGPKTKSENKVV